MGPPYLSWRSEMNFASLERLSRSRFRANFKLEGKELAYARQKGARILAEHTKDFIQSRLAPAHPARDGKQTPYRGHPVFIAQHATATCCRSCLNRWHKVPKNRPLREEELERVVRLIVDWIKGQPGIS